MKWMLLLISAILMLPVYADDAKGPFYNPVALFADSFLPVLAHFEKAKIETTWRGFYLRADNQSGFRNEHTPSEAGIYLNVAVRDPQEIPKFEDSSKVSGKLTEEDIALPAIKSSAEEGALRIVFIYGPKANVEAVTSINKSIGNILKIARVTSTSGP